MTTKLLGWAMGPIGKWVLMALLAAGWTVFNRADAARKARAECQLEQTEAALVAERKRADDAEQIVANARERADAAQVELAELETARNELLDELDAQGTGCDMPDDLRERLLGIN